MSQALNQSSASGRWQARSVVLSCDGIVAAESPLAAQAGAQILAQGGHAVDAAVAANAVMGVVAPHSCGIGGDLFAIIYEARTGELAGLNASGWSPAQISIERIGSRSSMPFEGIHTVTVPGAVDGWDKLLSRFGRLKLADLLAAAIYYAQDGFPVSEWVAQRWDASEQLLAADPNASRTFLPDGHAPRFGEVFRNPDLAAAYRQIASAGRDAFYSGEIAQQIMASSQHCGGTMSAADLEEFSSEWVAPISTMYRGWTVYEMPPNGAGVAALAMLKLMEQFPLGELEHNSADALHILIEAKKLAYADMLRHVCDPRNARIPIAEILSKDYATRRAELIDRSKANCAVRPGQISAAGGDTIYLAAVDREGNMASLIQSNYGMFGSGIVPEKYGFALQNRGNLFSLDPSHPNALAGRKRPLHTILPALMAKGDVRLAFGIQGGWNQSQAHAQFVSNLVDHGMNIQAALEAARFTKLTFEGCDVQMEDRISEPVRSELTRRGHHIELLPTYSDVVGGGQAVMRDYSTAVNYGASDPRKDGAAIPEIQSAIATD